jgi:COP9 signalosome complex subunit 5
MANSQAGIALQTFSLTNDIVELTAQDEIYRWDPEGNTRINNEAPWRKEYTPIN